MVDKLFIEGFVSGIINISGHFYFQKNKKIAVPFIVISTPAENMDLLFKLKEFFNFGALSFSNQSCNCQYRITNKKDCIEMCKFLKNKFIGTKKTQLLYFEEILNNLDKYSEEELNIQLANFKHNKKVKDKEAILAKFNNLAKKYGYSSLL